MSQNVEVQIKLADVITKDGQAGRVVDHAISAALEVVVKAYVTESPRNIGDFVGEIRPRKRGYLDYIVENKARDRGRNYPYYLYEGTYRLRGAPDYGFTTGHVRAGTVAYGIGGIRPNKAAKRAKQKAEVPFMRKVTQLTALAITK